MHTRSLLWVIMLLCSLFPSSVLAQTEGSISISTRFYGTTSLDLLSAGASGSGLLLYYAAGAALDQPSLVVRLNKDTNATQATADVFQAPDSSHVVPVVIRNQQPALAPGLQPSINIVAADGWWVQHDKVNYNLDIKTYGPIYSMWGAQATDIVSGSGWLSEIHATTLGSRITVRDPQGDGLPKWDLRLLAQAFPGRGYYRTNYSERQCSTPITVDRGVSPLWPYVALTGGFEQSSGVFRPPIVVDWSHGKITHFSELVTVRNQNCSYAIYAINQPQANTVNQLDFETPFAFYDLSNEGQGTPDLVIRTGRYPARDPWSTIVGPAPELNIPVPDNWQQIRYSWRDAVGDQKWDYKIELLGFHPYTYETTLADGALVVDAPPYEKFPTWVTERSWPLATFIDTEEKSYRSSEGIYEWPPDDIGNPYLWGAINHPDPEAFQTMSQPFRGEYRTRKDLPPDLYLSPIDNRLHLLGAEGGLWRVDDQRVIRVSSEGNDHYISHWQRERTVSDTLTLSPTTVIEEQLHALPGYLLYSSEQGTELRRAVYQPSLLETRPPTDHASWLRFKAQVEPITSQRRDPMHLHSWLDAFPGATLQVPGAQIADVRAIAGGFRFVLDLPQGFVGAPNELLDLSCRPVGHYLVQYDGQFTVQPLTPPHISASVSGINLAARQQGTIRVALRNDGLQDLTGATLDVWATPPSGQPTLVTSQTLDLLASTPITPSIAWVPPVGGAWQIAATLHQPDGQTRQFAPTIIEIAGSTQPSPETVLLESVSRALVPLIIVALCGFVLLAGSVIARQWWRVPGGKQ